VGVNNLNNGLKQSQNTPSPLSEKVQLPLTPNENKHIFKIEEDEEAKEYSYNLNQPDSDDEDDDYEENESDENNENDEKKNSVEKKTVSKENENTSSQEKSTKLENQNPQISQDKSLSNTSVVNENLSGISSSTNAEFDLSQEEFEIQNVCHRIYSKVRNKNISY
jgi:hypothetical protein